MSDSYIVDNLFTRNRLHLIFGPPRSGCSTLLHQIMWDWANAREVLGNKSFPAPFCLVDATRPLSEVRAQLHDLEIPRAEVPHISLMEITSHEDRTIEAAFHKTFEAFPTRKVIFLDGLQALFHGNVIHYRDVLNFTIDVSKRCQRDEITLIATLNTSKSLEGSDTPILQRVMGSTAWLKTAGTLLHISPESGRDLEPERTMTCFIPRRKPIQSKYIFTDTGKLEYQGDATQHPEMDAWLQQITPGSEITSEDMRIAGEARNMSRATVYRWLKQQIELGTLVLVERGTRDKPGAYRKPDTKPS